MRLHCIVLPSEAPLVVQLQLFCFFVIVIAPLPPYRWQHLATLGQGLAVRQLFGTAALGPIGVLHSPCRGSFGYVAFRLRLGAKVDDVVRGGVVVTYTLRAQLVLEGIVTYTLHTLSLGLVKASRSLYRPYH